MTSHGAGPRRPVIGLSTYDEEADMLAWHVEFAMLQRSYVDAVYGAGGLPVLLPPLGGDSGCGGVDTGGAADQVLDAVSGLVLTGGADVGSRPLRDAWEAALFRAAFDRDLPLLAVCRGMQVVNVALGGTLIEHVPDVVGTEAHRPEPGAYASVPVRLRADSRIGALLGPTATGSCSHHQAVGRVADGVRVVGRADDGIVEAIEHPGRTFLWGVQWHPEEDTADARLFQALVRAATDHVTGPAATR
ncbi:MAG: gamma-glutamyl-gamma-aminobutyrate hydrolase family protein [Streptosporangiales bacterium]|nr:gamma-glutamyl-gamma-aminobutyrate hydrolase family protein [Streptosporangiales bacterium]MBO0891669.1 gamma-glutamyl-gamma-aminobutyrate hydrolase family protein [Acidothermales bacterium]